ncbi:hypothetical protein C8Q72DRAFT_791495 [Fomitopsis betulina]|nr:hypothetical protein C8Q72DRAFT_791495 [Fomitopsis betulina]
MRSTTALVLFAAAASVAPALAAPISFSSDLEVRDNFDALEARDFENTFSRREFEEELYARALDEELYARALDEELYARALDEELVARSKIGKKIGNFFKKAVGFVAKLLRRDDVDVLARELGLDADVFAREYDDLVARDFDGDALLAREFDEELFARDFHEELFARAFDEELSAREFNENRFVARALGVEEELVARSKIGRKIGNFFKKVGKGILGVVTKFLKREDDELAMREDSELVMRELDLDDELLARASYNDYAQLQSREFDDEMLARAFDEFDELD